MANHLDLEEQEQLDQIKHFWKQHGNLILGAMILVLGALAVWTGYQYWQRGQSEQSAAMYDEFHRLAQSGDVDKADRAFNDMKSRFSSATYTDQAGLSLAKMSNDAGKPEVAKLTLRWVMENASDKGYAAVARLRLSGILIEARAYDDALSVLADDVPDEFKALVADRKADIYVLMGKKTEAKVEYEKSFKLMNEQTEYRRLVEVKLNAMGVNTGAEIGAK